MKSPSPGTPEGSRSGVFSRVTISVSYGLATCDREPQTPVSFVGAIAVPIVKCQPTSGRQAFCGGRFSVTGSICDALDGYGVVGPSCFRLSMMLLRASFAKIWLYESQIRAAKVTRF
jgi:hypothetical protein